jgi:hypothetical protein
LNLDSTKGRYIKILPNHHARALGGTSTLASREAVEAKKLEEKRQAKEEEKTKDQKLSIKRSNIMQRGFTGLRLSQELNATTSPSTSITTAWTESLESLPVIDCTRKSEYIHTVTRHPRSRMLLSVQKPPGNSETFALSGWMSNGNINPNGSDGEWQDFCVGHGRFSSLNFWGNYYAVISTLQPSAPTYIVPCVRDEENGWPVEARLGCRIETSHWSASVNPEQSQLKLAIGTSDGLVMKTLRNDFQSYETKVFEDRETNSDCLSTQWVSESTCAVGQRNGRLNLVDVRSGDASFRLKHARSVLKIKRVDEARLLLAGPRCLSMYDLRYCPAPDPGHSTRAYVWYPRYDNESFFASDLDISPRLRLIGTILRRGRAEVWDLWSGKSVYSPLVEKGIIMPGARHFSFVYENTEPNSIEEAGRPKGFLITTANTIHEWGID